MTIDECLAKLHAGGWSVGDTAIEQNGVRLWFVYGHRDDQKILGRALSQADAWRSAVRSAASVE